MASIADIAREAGYSTYVVSCALRGVGHVSAQKRARVMEVAAKLGYRPNGPAALLAMQRHAPRAAVRQVPVACLCAGDITTGYTSTSRSFAEAAKKLGLQPHLIRKRECGSISQTLDRLWAQGVEGIFLRPEVLGQGEEALTGADWSRFCVVKEGRGLQSLRFHLLRQSAFDLMSATLEETVARGYRRIAVALRPLASARDEMARLGGYLAYRHRQARRRVRLDLREFPIDPSSEEILDWTMHQRPDAVIFHPFHSYVFFQEAGIRAPEDFAVATLETFGPVPDLPDFSGCLSAADEYGRRAAEHLARLLQNGERGMVDLPLQEVIEPIWHEGETMPDRS